VFGRAVAGFPIGHVDEPDKALAEVCLLRACTFVLLLCCLFFFCFFV
jgi:hypothetical protein